MTHSDKNIWTIRYFFLCFLTIGLTSQSYGQKEMESPQSTQSIDPDSSMQESSWSFGGFPMIFYGEQTGLAGGIGGQLVYAGQSEQHSSSIGMGVFYTQKKQYAIGSGFEIYLKEGTYKFIGETGYSYFPDTFYGIGNNNSKHAKEDYTSRLFGFEPLLQKKIHSNLYIGFQYGYNRAKLAEREEGKMLDTLDIPGSEEGAIAASGMGITSTWDSRDDNLYPTNGSYHQFAVTSYGPSLGSDYIFNSYLLDLRHYRRIFGEHILAFRGVAAISTGNPPFQMMRQLGFYLRGYTVTRFVDKDIITFQAEYRRPLRGIFGMVAFAGFGQVADGIGSFALDELKPAVGLGLRIAIIPVQKVNLRIDMGIGKDDSSFDINIMEVF